MTICVTTFKGSSPFFRSAVPARASAPIAPSPDSPSHEPQDLVRTGRSRTTEAGPTSPGTNAAPSRPLVEVELPQPKAFLQSGVEEAWPGGPLVCELPERLETCPPHDPYRSDENSWNPIAEAQLEAFLDRCRTGEIVDPVAVFDFDGTICKDDIGEGFLKWLIANGNLQDVDYSQDIYGQYEAAVQKDHATGYAFAVQLMQGIEEEKLREWAQNFANDFVPSHVFPKQRELIARLGEAGVDVHIVSASNRWLVEAAGPLVGVAADHAVGVQSEVKDGKLTNEIIPPVTYRQGKVEAIRKYVGEKVDFAAGNAWTDYEMCQFAGEMALMINPDQQGPDCLFRDALGQGWAVQKWG